LAKTKFLVPSTVAIDFMDPECLHYYKLMFMGNTITAKNPAKIFGRLILRGQSIFTVRI